MKSPNMQSEPRASKRAEDAGWTAALHRRIEKRHAENLLRESRRSPEGTLDLSSNDYLGLRRHPHLANVVARVVHESGVGAGSSRIVSGTSRLHEAVEKRLASLKGAARALITPTGYIANLATLTALPAPGDLILGDKLNHASLIDAARLAGAAGGVGLGRGKQRVAFRTYRHKDTAQARERAERRLRVHPGSTVWIVTDAVFSMDGDLADLRALGALRDELDAMAGKSGGGCALIVDEAHATGVLGPGGAGLDAACGHVADVVVSTASKALGSLGGVISGPEVVIRSIENFARSFMYTTGASPMQVGAIDAALDILRDEPERRERLGEISHRIRAALREGGWDVAPAELDPTPIIPLRLGGAEAALALSERLRQRGMHAPAIRAPTVAPGSERVRLSLRADLSKASEDSIISAIGRR